ncbi:MAG: 23S rRNA (adenine(2030)-N(6))-methyltransferase RlmJ [Hyphomicrobiaceae bacterium]
MNYRHAFHAGNFADVLKHAVLALVIEHLKLKPAPFRVIDTHAGAGLYDLTASQATRTGEALLGIRRLAGPDAPPLPAEIAPLLAPYLAACAAFDANGTVTAYPGSPLIALHAMRPQDRLIANELHPEDAALLKAAIGRDARAKVLELDGWQALKATLPPKERRGVVVIDPPFEVEGEFERLGDGLDEAMRRFATGIYLLWLPIKSPARVAAFKDRLRASPHAKLLYAELRVRAFEAEEKLSATALVLANPPFRLAEQLGVLLPFLSDRLAQGHGASHALEWLKGPD